MTQRTFLARDLAILLAVILVLLFASIGIIRLVGHSPAQTTGPSPTALALEAQLKNIIQESVLSQENLVEGPEIHDAMAAMLERLLENAEPLPFEIEIYIIDSPVVNALTLPGGIIVVYAGLMKRLESADEMASILAHEIGHVANRDVMKKLAGQIGLSLLVTLGGGQVERAARRLVQQIVSVHYSRFVEAQADEFALALMAKAGIDPVHFARALERLRKDQDDGLAKVLKYLDTHPDIDARIEKARLHARSLSATTARAFDLDWQQLKRALPTVF